MTASQTILAGPLDRKPSDDEIDVYGLTHPGKVRPDNQDHFLICALRKQIVVNQTSLPETNRLMAGPERLAFLAMVADGVGGGARGEVASRLALEGVTRYVSGTMDCYYAAQAGDDLAFFESLQAGAVRCHEELRRHGEEDPDFSGMATTLTLYLGVWPRAYLLQVGDSRCYLFRNGELHQLSRDQTMAQELLDLGVLTKGETPPARLVRTLSSSLGGRQSAPMVTRFDMTWGTVVLLCSDGLTHHVPDGRIREVLRSMKSAQQACEDLLADALADGGSDNITIIVGRAVPRA